MILQVKNRLHFRCRNHNHEIYDRRAAVGRAARFVGHGPDMVHVHPLPPNTHNSTRQDFLKHWTWNQLVTVKILVCTIHLAQMLDRTPKTLNFRRYHTVIFVPLWLQLLWLPMVQLLCIIYQQKGNFLPIKIVSFTFRYDRATYFKILTKQLHRRTPLFFALSWTNWSKCYFQ